MSMGDRQGCRPKKNSVANEQLEEMKPNKINSSVQSCLVASNLIFAALLLLLSTTTSVYCGGLLEHALYDQQSTMRCLYLRYHRYSTLLARSTKKPKPLSEALE